MDFDQLILWRQSTRTYEDRQITREQVEKILAAANRAPVGSNLYKDIHITVVQNKETLLTLCEAAWKRFSSKEKVREIAGDTAEGKNLHRPNLFYGAPTVFFVSHRVQDLQPGIDWANVTSVTALMHLEATDLGLGSVFMWGALESMRLFPELDHTSLLELPQGFTPLIGLAVGHPARALGASKKRHAPIAVNFVP